MYSKKLRNFLLQEFVTDGDTVSVATYPLYVVAVCVLSCTHSIEYWARRVRILTTCSSTLRAVTD